MKRIVTKLALIGSGALLGLIGGAVMLSPKGFLELSGVLIGDDPSLLSELSAPGGVLLMTGALMLIGAVQPRHAKLALIAGGIVYGGYGIGRLSSLSIHGMPSEALVTATIIELATAALLWGLGLAHHLDADTSRAPPQMLRAPH
ncbi:MAG: DUF4345 domain-containing protein [Henriciella sp.]